MFQSFYLFVVFILSICVFVDNSCNFTFTNETKNQCELSKWIEWNCTCCGTNVVDLALATRMKAICCPKDMNTVQKCMDYCNVSTASLVEQGLCGNYCSSVTDPSPCYVPTTSSTTQATTTISASSTSTYSTFTTTSSTSTATTPVATTTMADQRPTSALTTRTTVASIVWSSNNPSISKLASQTTTPFQNERKRFCIIGSWQFVVYENELSA